MKFVMAISGETIFWSLEMKNLFILVLLLALIILTGCPDAPVRPDPCDGKMPVTADFKITQKVFNFNIDSVDYIETEVLLTSKTVMFEGQNNYYHYEWQLLGDSTIYFGKKQFFWFDVPWGKLTMRLIVKGYSDTTCFPNDDRIDTMYKDLYVKDKRNAEVIGSYKGCHEDNPTDSFTVDIKYPDDREIIIYNINRGCFTPDSNAVKYVVHFSYCNHLIFFDGQGGYGFGCESPKGSAILQKDGKTIIIDYESGEPKERKKYKFTGIKQ